jgi:hypothetical protein
MAFRKFGIFTLGLGMLAGSAHATTSYQSSQTSFASQATTTDGLTLSSLITFTAANLTTINGIACGCTDDEYIDPTTGIEFLAFNGSGSGNVAFGSVAAGVLTTQAGLGDSIEVIFPTPVDYGFAFNFTTAYTYETFCIDPTTSFSTCASGGTTITSGNSGFIGAINSTAPLTAVWLALNESGSAGTDLQSFEVANPAATPEGPTMLLIGPGLIGLLFYRRRRQRLEN